MAKRTKTSPQGTPKRQKRPKLFQIHRKSENVLTNLEFYCKENLKDLAHMKPEDWLPKSKNYKSDKNGSIEREFSWFAKKVERLKQNEALQESRMKSNFEQNSFGKNSDEFILQSKKDKYSAKNVNKAILQKREKLPAYQMFESDIWPKMKNQQVIVLSGDTGCGKTTQIPQLILDKEIENGNFYTKIVCTQPRRIAAISVANRVSEERGENELTATDSISVGYHVKMDVKPPRDFCSILYCTPGIVLQWLRNDKKLDQVSYLILDEVHERNLETDFLMVICKLLLPLRPDLKLILMSATMNTESFSKYYKNNQTNAPAPIIEIPGKMYPIKEYFLDELYDLGINLNVWQNNMDLRKIVPKFMQMVEQRRSEKYSHNQNSFGRNQSYNPNQAVSFDENNEIKIDNLHVETTNAETEQTQSPANDIWELNEKQLGEYKKLTELLGRVRKVMISFTSLCMLSNLFVTLEKIDLYFRHSSIIN